MSANKAFLEKVKLQTDELFETYKELTAGLSAEQLSWKSGKNKWCIADCLEHLHKSVNGYVVNINSAKANKKLKPDKKNQKYTAGILGKVMQFFVKPQNRKIKIPSPPHFRPSDSKSPDAVLKDFENTIKGLRSLADLLDNVDLNQHISSPVSSIIIIKLGDVFEVNFQHIKRHFIQIEEIKTHPDFPVKHTESSI